MTPQQIADANIVESIRAHARWQRHSTVVEQNGLLLAAGPTRFPAACLNAAIRIDALLDPREALVRAREFFESRDRGFTFVTRKSCDADLEALLAAEGLTCDTNSPCMIIESRIAMPATTSDVRIERLATPQHVADFIVVSAQAYQAMGLPPEQTQATFSNADGVLDSHTTGFIAYLNDKPASAALTVYSDDAAHPNAGIYWVGTVPDARGKRLAEICTSLATNAGFERGAKAVTLQASKFGEPIYRRMGYREYDRQSWFRHAGPKR